MHSLKSKTRRANLDAAISIMTEESIHTYVLQETWLDGTEVLEINGFHVFTHVLSQQTCNQGQCRVVIILATSLYDAYFNSGSSPPIAPKDPEHPSYGCFIGLQFKIEIKRTDKGAFKKNQTKKTRSLKKNLSCLRTHQ